MWGDLRQDIDTEILEDDLFNIKPIRHNDDTYTVLTVIIRWLAYKGINLSTDGVHNFVEVPSENRRLEVNTRSEAYQVALELAVIHDRYKKD